MIRLQAPSWWYGPPYPLLHYLLRPVSLLFAWFARARRRVYEKNYLRIQPLPVPVIVVGNITVGGAGKTTAVIALALRLQTRGFRVGIVSRGFGGRSPHYPLEVEAHTPLSWCGEEPKLIHQKTQCPVVVAPDRLAAARYLLSQSPCTLILSDDGLQHHRLPRDIEVILEADHRPLGNGYCLPAGPLREPPLSLRKNRMILEKKLCYGELPWVPDTTPLIHAVAGIARPQGFFKALEEEGFQIIAHAFPDHHVFTRADFNFSEKVPIVMTEKDIIKCDFLKESGWLYAAWPVEQVLEEDFLDQLVEGLSHGR